MKCLYCEKKKYGKACEKGTCKKVQNHPEKEKMSTIDEQTLQFWHLQLQFMELDSDFLILGTTSVMKSKAYVKNKKTKKVLKILADAANWGKLPDRNQKACLATHLALQLAGLGEM